MHITAYIEVHIDENLSWDCHVDTICKKIGAGIGAMRRVKNFVPVATLEIVHKGLVQPYFEYCSPLWDTCGKLLKDKLQRNQSRAATVLTGASYDNRSANLIHTYFIVTSPKGLFTRTVIILHYL